MSIDNVPDSTPSPADVEDEVEYLRWKDEQALAQYEAERQRPDYEVEDDEP